MLATQIIDTRIELEETLLDILNQLNVLATSLDIAINILRREEHQEIKRAIIGSVGKHSLKDPEVREVEGKMG